MNKGAIPSLWELPPFPLIMSQSCMHGVTIEPCATCPAARRHKCSFLCKYAVGMESISYFWKVVNVTVLLHVVTQQCSNFVHCKHL